MKNFFVPILFILMSCSSQPPKSKPDPLTDLLTTAGVMEALNIKLEVEFQSLKESNPNNEAFFECVKPELSSTKIVDTLRPYYDEILTPDDMVSLNNFFKSPLGNKFLLLSKNPSLYKSSSAYFTESEKEQLSKFLTKFSKLSSENTNIVLANAINEGSQKLANSAIEKCSSLKN